MLAYLVLVAAAAAPVCRAATATIFPVALGPEANLQGEIIGVGGDVGTTYVLSGNTRGITFTLTLAEDATHVVERVSIPTRSFDLSVDCVVDSGSAICENVVVSGGVTTIIPTTLPFSPFAIPVSTLGIVPSTIPASESPSSGVTTTRIQTTSTAIGTSFPSSSFLTPTIVDTSFPASSFSTSIALTDTHSASSASSPTAPVSLNVPSALSSQPAVSPSSVGLLSTAILPSTSVASIASPSANQPSTNDASRYFAPSRAVILAFAVVPWILA